MIVKPVSRYIINSYGGFPKDNLLAFWNFENASNADPVPADFGSYSLNLWIESESILGKIGNAYYFPGGSGLYTNEEILNLVTNPTSYSVSCWMRFADVDSAFTLWGNGFGSMGFHFDYINDESYYGAGNYGITMNMSTSPGPYNWQRTFAGEPSNAGQWYHVVGTYNYPSTTMKLYIDGVLKDTNTNAVFGQNSQPNWNGFAVNGSVYPGGKEYGNSTSFDALGIWNKELNTNEIATLYNGGQGIQYA